MTPEQITDLRPGDVVEYRRNYWPEGAYVRGPVEQDAPDRPMYVLRGTFGIAEADGSPYSKFEGTLTVVSRAPRPMYVNHPRTEPVAGDVVRDCDGDAWHFDVDEWWCASSEACDEDDPLGLPIEAYRPLRLLWDGETGQVVQ